MGTIPGSKLTDATEYVKSLYYGRYGTGKTTNVATMANHGLMVAVDFEGGFKKKALAMQGINVDNIHLFNPRSFAEAEQVYWEIDAMINGGINVFGVGVDNWTEMQDIFVRDSAVVRINRKRRELEPQLPVSESARHEYEELSEFATQKYDYGIWTNEAKRLARWYRDLPCHVAFVAHELFDEETGKIVPALSKQARNKIAGGMDEVIYTHAQEVKSEDRIEFSGVGHPLKNYVGKDRLGILPPVLINPTMSRIIGLHDGTLDLEKDEAQQAYLSRRTTTK
jgi:hypothetical protein